MNTVGQFWDRPFVLGTPGVEASAPCPIPGSGSWASYRTPPTPGPPTLLITGHRPGHGEKPAGAVILGRDRWRKGAQQRKRTGWGMGDISERADRLGGVGQGEEAAPDQGHSHSPPASPRAGTRWAGPSLPAVPTPKPSTPQNLLWDLRPHTGHRQT